MMQPKLKVALISKVKDCFGVWEVAVTINERLYTYPIESEYILKKIEKMIRLKKYGKAIHLLSQFKVEGFNYFEETTNGI